jgi:glycerol transport system substrate-binding protein
VQWFIDAAKRFAGMEINVLSESIPTQTYEATVLARAFEEITGIKVNHQLLGKGEVVQAVQAQMQTGRNL